MDVWMNCCGGTSKDVLSNVKLITEVPRKNYTRVNCETLSIQQFGINARLKPPFQDMSISCIDIELVEHEVKGVKRKNHQGLDLELTNNIIEKSHDEARISTIKHFVDRRSKKNKIQDDDTSPSEKQEKVDDFISACSGKIKVEDRRKSSLEVQRDFRSEKQILNVIAQNPRSMIYHEEFEEQSDTWRSLKWEFDEIVSSKKNRWSMNETKMSVKDTTDTIDFCDHLNFDIERSMLPEEKLPLIGDHGDAKGSKTCAKRNRDEDVRNRVKTKKKKSDQGSKRRKDLSCKSQAKEINSLPDYEVGSKERISKNQLKVVSSYARAEVMQGGRRANQTMNDVHQRLVRAINNYNTSSTSDVKFDRLRSKVRVHQDEIDKKFPPKMRRDDKKQSNRVHSDMHIVSNPRDTYDACTQKSSTYKMQKFGKTRKQSPRNDDYPNHDFVQEKRELNSRVLEIKRRFSSKVVIPKIEREETYSWNFSMLDGDFKSKGDQEYKKKLKFIADVAQDESQQELENDIKKKSSTMEKIDDYKFEETNKVDPIYGSELTSMDHEDSILTAKTAETSIEVFNGRSKTKINCGNLKERQRSHKSKDIKKKLEVQAKDINNRLKGEKTCAFNKISDGLRNTRAEDTISRMSNDICLLSVVEGDKQKVVKPIKSLLRRHAIYVDSSKDDDAQCFSSYELKNHKHRDRSHCVSPKLRNHILQKKENDKSMSPHRSEKDLSDWEKFEKERNNTLAALDSRYRRFGGGTSGLGGYSPRRRRSEAAIKTPSPPPQSSERRKPRAWDLPPPGMDKSMVAAISATHQAIAQHVAIQHAATTLASVTPLVYGSMFVPHGATSASTSYGITHDPTMISSFLQQVNPSVTAITLTQATRPLRRLYVGNVPSTVSDGELLEFLNAEMLSTNANHLAGTKPCINCSVNVDKSYAFAEFITPEDATAALAFDGVTLHGTTLKIRRPKDFIQTADGGVGNASSIFDMVSSTVQDSPRKVFVGGISSSLSAEKIKEIVTAFGQLKAYHWEVDKTKQHPQAYAFLEYMDPTATSKACAGLNGMKLGTRFLTVVQAIPPVNPEMTKAGVPSYGVPDHAKTLLQKPSRILELQNMVTEDEMRLMCKHEIDEMTEDIYLECSRFGNVRSMHVIRCQFALMSEKETRNFSNNTKKVSASVVNSKNEDIIFEHSKVAVQSLHVDEYKSENLKSSSIQDDTSEATIERIQVCCREKSCEVSYNTKTNALEMQDDNALSDVEDLNNARRHVTTTSQTRKGVKICEDMSCEHIEQRNVSAKVRLVQEGFNTSMRDTDYLHLGKVYVEFSREESASQAAHNFHGRTFAGRTVTVSYFSLKAYQKKFFKGIRSRTNKEKQTLPLAIQGHLTAQITD